ncbi:type II toxin-antitoxin system VapC family toxin [Streptomyces alanosinicus]|uniref:PIN domain-containing protein n=1 Tax=Streptomyces alanosinicus TaxID=68171 RepID=A0A918YLR2_9ACTN|nr:hypothetical protein GCM10010339_57670 [Streptomyces alanosinicus]
MTTSMENKSNHRIIVADTSGLVSLFNATDSNHQVAVEAALRLMDPNVEIDVAVPLAVFLECYNVLGRQLGHIGAIQAVGELSRTFRLMDAVDRHTIDLTEKLFLIAPASVSHTDCLVMACCDEFGTREIFGFDRAFTKAGYSLPPF